LKLGAGRDATGAFTAHAWVEREGRIVVGGFEPGTYVELAYDGDSAGTALAGRF
jgi:hypothetical protein